MRDEALTELTRLMHHSLEAHSKSVKEELAVSHHAVAKVWCSPHLTPLLTPVSRVVKPPHLFASPACEPPMIHEINWTESSLARSLSISSSNRCLKKLRNPMHHQLLEAESDSDVESDDRMPRRMSMQRPLFWPEKLFILTLEELQATPPPECLWSSKPTSLPSQIQ